MLLSTPNPHGGDRYSVPVSLDFSANINPYGTPEAVIRAVINTCSALSHYPDPYCRALREAIAAREGVAVDQVLCGNGAAELIYAFCAAIRPRKALLLGPGFSEYEAALQAQGSRIQTYLLSEAEDFLLGEDFLKTLAAFDGDCLFLCNPNNPTGQLIAPALLSQIVSLCKEKGIRLLLDECFLDLCDDCDGISQKGVLDSFPGIILKAFTKSYGMAGLRLGYCLCGNSSLLEAMSRQCQCWNVSIPAQAAGIAALSCGSFREKALTCIAQQRPVLIHQLQALGLRVIPGRANYLLFFSPWELKAPLLERGILIRSCDNYKGLSRGWYRIAVKLPEENRVLLHALEEIIHG